MAAFDTPCGSCKKETCSAKTQRPGESDEHYLERVQLQRRMCRIKNKIIILSGKGGVGKSTVAVNLAMALALAEQRVGLLDADMHGPSVPKLLNIEGLGLRVGDGVIIPHEIGRLKVVSMSFLLRSSDDAVIWRGPMKMAAIKQFLKDVEWGELDYLIVDCPPGTGDEPLSVIQLMEELTGAIVVTTPQEVALLDVRKSITFCIKLNVPVLGVIENMSGFVCPKCGKVEDIFKAGGGERMAAEMGVPFLGRIPLDPLMVAAGDEGRPFVYFYSKSKTAQVFADVAELLLRRERVAATAVAPVFLQTHKKE